MEYFSGEQQEQVAFNPLAILWQIFLLMFFVDTFFAGAILFYLQFTPTADLNYSFIILLWALHTLKFILMCYLVLRATAAWAMRKVYITGHHIIVARGILKSREELYELQQLRSVVMRQSWLGRRLNYGSIKCIFTASGYTTELSLPHVVNPGYYEAIIGRHLGED